MQCIGSRTARTLTSALAICIDYTMVSLRVELVSSHNMGGAPSEADYLRHASGWKIQA